MNRYSAKAMGECLTVESNLPELNRVAPWIEKLARMCAIPEHTRDAMDLCLDEVLSNIIRHGYKGKQAGIIRLRCLSHQDGCFTLVVEDEAPAFNPLTFQFPRVPDTREDIPLGGHGIHLLKEFADALDYEPRPNGNQLMISFNFPEPSATPR